MTTLLTLSALVLSALCLALFVCSGQPESSSARSVSRRKTPEPRNSTATARLSGLGSGGVGPAESLAEPGPRPTRDPVVALAEAAVRSDNENMVTLHLAAYRASATAVTQRLVAIALDPREMERVRVLALYLLAQINAPLISEPQARVILAFIEQGSAELRRQAVLLISPEAAPCPEIGEVLLTVADGPATAVGVAAARVLADWGFVDTGIHARILGRALAASQAAADSALESVWRFEFGVPDVLELAGPLAALVRDRRRSLARLDGVALSSEVWPTERRYIALLVASRLPREVRDHTLSTVRDLEDGGAEFCRLAEFCLAMSYGDSGSHFEALLASSDQVVRWAALLRALKLRDTPRDLVQPMLGLALDPADVFVRMLRAWVCGLDDRAFVLVLNELRDEGLRNLVVGWREHG